MKKLTIEAFLAHSDNKKEVHMFGVEWVGENEKWEAINENMTRLL